MMAPNIEKPMMNPTPDAAVKVRFLNRVSGISGSTALDSTTQKATINATPATARPMMMPEPHRYWVPPQVVSRMMAVTPDDMRAVPSQSILCWTRLAGMWSTAATVNRATMPMGTLM